MAFPKKSLNNDEAVALDLHPHWWYFAEPAFSLLAVIVIGVIVLAKGPVGTAGDVLRIVIIAGLVLAALWLVWRYLKWATTHFVITSQRVVYRSGVFSKSGIEIPLDRVNNVNFHQSVFERMLGAGDLLIESGGEDGQSRYTDIHHPDRVQKLIHAQIEVLAQRRGGYGPGAGPSYGAGRGSNLAPPPPGSSVGALPVDVADQLERLEGMLSRGTLTTAEFEAQKRKLLGS